MLLTICLVLACTFVPYCFTRLLLQKESQFPVHCRAQANMTMKWKIFGLSQSLTSRSLRGQVGLALYFILCWIHSFN